MVLDRIGLSQICQRPILEMFMAMPCSDYKAFKMLDSESTLIVDGLLDSNIKSTLDISSKFSWPMAMSKK